MPDLSQEELEGVESVVRDWCERLLRAEQRAEKAEAELRSFSESDSWADLEAMRERAEKAEAALRDAAVVIERMANGASRKACNPELERVRQALLAGADDA